MVWSSYQEFYDWFWDESIWLPKVVTWKVLKANRLPLTESLGGLYLCIPIAVILLIVRYVFERCIARPFVQWLGVKVKPPVKVSANGACEKVYRKTKKPNHHKVLELSEHLGWSTREVERWFRLRRTKDQPTVLTKATECSWRFLFYFTATLYGIITLTKYGFLYDVEKCFIGFKTHVMEVDLYIYYIMETAVYIALSISQFTDVKRKDFLQNLIHHFLTLGLLMCSYTCGFFYLGSVVVLTHDISDVFLEAGKILNYAKFKRSCEACFLVFTAVFYFTRLYFLPFHIIYTTVTSYNKYNEGYRFVLGDMMVYFLYVLEILHIYWAYCIAVVVYKGLIGKGMKDSRSEGEESEWELKNDEYVPLENKKKS